MCRCVVHLRGVVGTSVRALVPLEKTSPGFRGKDVKGSQKTPPPSPHPVETCFHPRFVWEARGGGKGKRLRRLKGRAENNDSAGRADDWTLSLSSSHSFSPLVFLSPFLPPSSFGYQIMFDFCIRVVEISRASLHLCVRWVLMAIVKKHLSPASFSSHLHRTPPCPRAWAYHYVTLDANRANQEPPRRQFESLVAKMMNPRPMAHHCY